MSEPAPRTLFAPSVEQQAVRDRGHASNVLVAAAGSGKTRVLTWLFCDAHVREGIPLDALLAITFTDKAAGELRRRIAVELEGHTLGREPDLSEAWIGTFHGVCARILREFAHRRGLDPAFGVIEELEALELQAEAWDEAVAGLLQAHGGVAASLLSQVGATPLRAAIVEWWKARRSAGEVHPELPTPRSTPADVVAAARRLERACERFAALADDLQSSRPTPLPTLARHLAVAEGTQELAVQVRARAEADALQPERVDGLLTALEAIKIRGGNPLPTNDERDAVLAARDELTRRIAEVFAGPRVVLLAELVGRFSRGYERCKRRGELLDFDDLELEALQLLREDDDVRLRLVERFERVLVDEFQDTNPRQAELVDLLAGGPMWIPVGGDGRPAVTVVGDPRQAIYGFRYADVGLIAGATERINEGGDLRLSTNYRSDAEVLAAIDAAFAKLDPAHEPVRAFRGPDGLPAGQARVELLITKEDRDEPWSEVELGARAGERSGPTLAEARLVAARIEALRAEEPGASIVVLARARSVLSPIAEALVDLGIPALIDGADGFWERLEVADLLAWLRLVRNPADDAALVAVCASPMIGLSVDGLAALGLLDARASDAGRTGALRQALGMGAGVGASPGEGPAFTPADARRLRGLLDLLARQRIAGRATDPAGLLDEAIAATAYDEHLLRLVGGDRRVANVMRLRRIAADIAAGGGDLTDLVERAEKEQGHELRAPEAAVAGSDAVTLMTVHQAKGLEFDIVIVAGLGSPQVVSSPALLGDADRLGLKLRPSPGVAARALFDHATLIDDLQRREDGELRRVLYVALTRARERLVVSGVARWTISSGSPFSREPLKTAPVLTWLAPAMVPDIDALVEAASRGPVRTRGGIELRVSTPGGTTLPAARRAPEVVDLPVHLGDGPDLAALPPLETSSVQPPRVLSYTALAAHATCGLRFHAERVLGLGPVLAPEENAREPALAAPALATRSAQAAEGARPEPGFGPVPVERPADADGPKISFASAKAPEGQLDLFAALDEPALRPAPDPRSAPAPTTPQGLGGLPPNAIGNAVHAVLEHVGPADAPAEVAAAVDAATPGPEWTAAPAGREEVAALVRVALTSATLAALWAHGAPRRELTFSLAVGAAGEMLTGVLDAWAPRPDGSALVVDYKTDRIAGGADLERKVGEQYALQRDAYALAALQAGASRVQVVHLFLRDPDRPVSAEYLPADVPALAARLADRVAAVRGEDRARATHSPDRWVCGRCPARGTLCGWPVDLTERPPGAGPVPVARWEGDPDAVRAPS